MDVLNIMKLHVFAKHASLSFPNTFSSRRGGVQFQVIEINLFSSNLKLSIEVNIETTIF